MVLSLLLACTGGDSAEEKVAAPVVSWLSPADAATVTAGTVAASIVVDDFTLEDPAAHNDGAAIGFVRVSVDGTLAIETASTTFDLTLDAGAHTLLASLIYSDGDEVLANADGLCEEDATDCDAVGASISVTAE